MKKIIKVAIFFVIFIFGVNVYAQNDCINSFYTDYRFTFNDKNEAVQKNDYQAKFKCRIDIDECEKTITFTSNKGGRERFEYDSTESVVLIYKENHLLRFYKDNVKIVEVAYDFIGNVYFTLFDEGNKRMFMHVEK